MNRGTLRSPHPWRAPALAALLGLGLLLPTRSASAQTTGRAEVQSAMDQWYADERRDAFLFLGVGVATTGGGVFLATRDDDIARGAGWTAIGFGALTMVLAVTYNLSLDPKHDELRDQLNSDPARFKLDETDRLRGIDDRFDAYRWGEVGGMFLGAGLAAYGTLADKQAFTGAGMVLAGESLILITLDYFAQRRVRRYLDVVERFDATAASGTPLSSRAFMLQHRGSF